MSEYEMKRLEDVEIVAEPTDETYVLVEQNGDLKRVPKTAVGGDGLVKTAIIKSSTYDEFVNFVHNFSSDPEYAGSAPNADPATYTYTCINMSYDEAVDNLLSGRALQIIIQVESMVISAEQVNYQPTRGGRGIITFSTPNADIAITGGWNVDGIVLTIN